MKKLMKRFCLVLLVFAILVPTAAMAAKDSGVVPTADVQGNVTIPTLPGGKIVQVYVWNDSTGAAERKLGAVNQFKLSPGEGFNFTWSGQGGTDWQLVTPTSRAGGSLVVDTSWKDAQGIVRCKYLFPKK